MTTQTWGWFGEDETVLTPGVIDDNARHAFSNGQCHALALGLHELTGWEIGGLQWCCEACGSDSPEWCGCDADTLPAHVVVRKEDGELIDIGGTVDFAEWGSDFRPVDPDALTYTYPDQGYLVPDLDAGRAFAETVLSEYGYSAAQRA